MSARTEEPCVFADYWMRLCVGSLAAFLGVLVLLTTLCVLWRHEATLRPLLDQAASDVITLTHRLFWAWASVNF